MELPKLHPIDDPRLTNKHIDYDVWRYILLLEIMDCDFMQGIDITEMELSKAFEEGQAPAGYIRQFYSSLKMITFDNQPAMIQWIRNYADSPDILQPDVYLSLGKDSQGYILQAYKGERCVAYTRFGLRTPEPPVHHSYPSPRLVRILPPMPGWSRTLPKG